MEITVLLPVQLQESLAKDPVRIILEAQPENDPQTQPFDAALVDDARVYHGVTPVQPLDPALPAHRDVLVVTFRNARAGG